MATKLVENIDEEVWNKLVGLSKIDRKTVGELLNDIIKEYFKKRGLK